MDTTRAHDLYMEYAAAIAYVAVETREGDEMIGTAFHIGENVWVTARHVVESKKILRIATTEQSIANYSQTLEENRGKGLRGEWYSPCGVYSLLGEPMLHPSDGVDVAVLKLDGPYGECGAARYGFPKAQPVPVVRLGGWLDDWIGNELMLTSVLVMGYPPIPFGGGPVLVATRAEVNTVLDKRQGRHPHFILSAMVRGGYSGAPALTTFEGATLGVAVESLIEDSAPTELGYFAVLTVEPIYDCLSHHNVLPDVQRIPGLLSENLGAT